MDYQQYCTTTYMSIYKEALASAKVTDENSRKIQHIVVRDTTTSAYKESPSSTKVTAEKERKAQHIAIRDTTVLAIQKYPEIEPAEIWKTVHSAHLYRKAGIGLTEEQVDQVNSAENSWKKSSGHAFEDLIKTEANVAFKGTRIEVHLQKDISTLINANKLSNLPPDLTWLNSRTRDSSFDLYITCMVDDKRFVYGCIQTKTSIRDRVTRDREPSIEAMAKYFWSTAIVLNGEFLAMSKFINMVNGGGSFTGNGWHGMYVFSHKYANGRIYSTNIKFDKFADHAVKAANFWREQRQWFNRNWAP